ncbi:TetR/AcrR family transcriptional regulator [Salinibacterium sp. NK8237]|uniref:TetR/AcrR family transcriptional regulator n=1 Tax=Salinibacterium sp. NK8237 TaxID=2792038 RepID=UPI0018CF3C81|nr:TetR family transcriptional regulator C-terminal domain-containing protein [Salinibacterium sp. NK8237]MBH0130025.1 TetR/AcrR family transcriptional regulator [Salinibacterium sp. NK8237]
MAVGTTRRRNPAERALEVREAAQTIALTRGLAAISLRNLATHCGVTAPLIAHYEPNMDALVASTFTAIAEKEIAEVTLHALAPVGPLDQFRALLSALADPARDNVGEVWCDAWSLGRKNEPLAEAARHSMDSWHALAIDIIRAGQDAGEFAAIAPERAALVLFALVDATASYQLVDFRSRETRDALVRETLEDMLDVSLKLGDDARSPSNKPTV